MRSVHHYFIMTMILLFLLPTGCRKDDASSDQSKADEHLMRDFLSDDYFATASKYYNPPPADPSAQTTTESRTKESMTAALKDYFAKNPKEVKKINQKYGYPVWEHAYNNTDEVGDFYFLPIAKTNKNKIESILFAYKKSVNEKLRFLMADRKDLSKLMKSKKAKKNNSGKYEEMTLELAVTSTALFEYNMFQSIDCELANLLKDTNLKTEMTESRSCYYVISYSVYGTHYVASDGTEVFTYHWSYYGHPICAYPTAYGPDGSTNAGTTNTTGIGGISTTDINSGSAIYIPGAETLVGLLDGKFLDCFNTTNNSNGVHSVTIYVDQPIPNSSATYSTETGYKKSNIDVGHTVISIKQIVSGVERIKTIGYYPRNSVTPNSPTTDGVFYDDGGKPFDVSYTISISPSQFNSLIQHIQNMTQYNTYHLNQQNCSDFAIDALSPIITIPDTYGSWPLGGGTNPGNLGQDLRNLSTSPTKTKNTTGGTGPLSKNCN